MLLDGWLRNNLEDFMGIRDAVWDTIVTGCWKLLRFFLAPCELSGVRVAHHFQYLFFHFGDAFLSSAVLILVTLRAVLANKHHSVKRIQYVQKSFTTTPEPVTDGYKKGRLAARDKVFLEPRKMFPNWKVKTLRIFRIHAFEKSFEKVE